MKKILKSILCLITMLLVIAVVVILYNYYDNNRVVVTKQNVEIENLPKSFENFTILQISDLHEKRFGENQSKLLKLINNQDYDMIVFTGDMQLKTSQDIEPFYELLDGIEDKKIMLYVPGNHGPEYNDDIKSKGCINLDKPYKIQRGDDIMWFYDFYNFDTKEFYAQPKEFKDEDIKISISHYPFSDDFYSQAEDKIGMYDLIISGHYHGGQIRIPFYGAIMIPTIDDGKQFFPDQSDVSGLKNYSGYQQYISRGLGSTSFKGLQFRLFNTPEINLITLTNQT